MSVKFHDYRTLRDPAYKGTSEHYIRHMLELPLCEQEDEMSAVLGAIELGWLTHDRPYYNVYPIAVELCLKTAMSMTWGDILVPQRRLLLRFAEGHEPLGIRTVLARVPSAADEKTVAAFHRSRSESLSLVRGMQLGGHIQTIQQDGTFWVYLAKQELKDELIKDTAVDINSQLSSKRASFTDRTGFLIRLLAFIGLLARGTDLITPAILSSDREEYDATSDAARKRWLEDRARKRLGRSFDVGRKLETERQACPHWRMPHLALFHTGLGRAIPELRVRSGCVVVPRDMSQVPTGYLGRETEEEINAPRRLFTAFRQSTPSRLRYRILRRDKYRCQLCGSMASDGAQLEVDHRVPVAKGGKTTPENLWTLCHPCNNGKSDSDLHIPEECQA